MTGTAVDPGIRNFVSPRRSWSRALRRLVLSLSLSLGLGLLLHAADAPAQPQGTRSEFSARTRIDAETAAATVRLRTGGRVLSVELRNSDRPVYLVRVLLSEGRVRSYRVDAQSGRVLE